MLFSRACAGLNRGEPGGLAIPILSTEGVLAEVERLHRSEHALRCPSRASIRFQGTDGNSRANRTVRPDSKTVQIGAAKWLFLLELQTGGVQLGKRGKKLTQSVSGIETKCVRLKRRLLVHS